MKGGVTAVPTLAFLSHCCSLVGGFHLGPSLSPHARFLGRPWRGRNVNARVGVSLRSKNGDVGDSETPFFARQVDTFTEANESDYGATDTPGSSGVAVAEETTVEEIEKSPESNKAMKIAADLKAQAEKVRLEAEKMDTMLTLEKIANLEKKLESKSLVNKHPDEAAEIRKQLQVLTKKLNAPKSERKSSVVANKMTPALAPAPAPAPEIQLAPGITSKDFNVTTASADDLYDMIPPMPAAELEARAEAFRKTPQLLQDMTAKAAGFDDAGNVTAIVEQMYKDEQVIELKKKLRASGEITPLDEETLAAALEGYMKLPLPIQDLIAKSVGMKDGRNATAVIGKLEEEGKLLAGSGVNGFEVDTEFITDVDLSDLFEDEEAAARSRFIEAQLPSVTRKADQIPSQDDVDVFFRDVLSKDTFNPTEKPISVPGGFLIYGENKKKSGEELVEALEKALATSSVSDRLQFFYMIDPSPIRKEELESLEGPDEKPPVILVTGPDFSPDTNRLVKPIVSALGLFFMASFALGSLSLNESAMNRFFDEVQSGVVDFSWIENMAAPLFVSVCLTQLAHEAAHQVVAWRDKFKAGLPTIVPSLQLGLMGGITPIESPPKNFKSLFDFSISGPLVGMAVSIFLMFSGLEATAFMDVASQAQLPSMPVNLVRASSLAGAMVQWVLGEGILLTPNPAIDTISLHPLAIAGFVGLVSNALSLLPLGNTDGGRVAQALFGRSWCRILTTFVSLPMVMLGLFGLDEANLLLSYAFFTTLWQRETEIPCRNEVDDLDVARGSVAIATFVLVMLTLIPMS